MTARPASVNALWAGGLARTPEWTDDGGHGTLRPRPRRIAATTVTSLVEYLQATYRVTSYRELDLVGNAVPDAEPGDVIAYDWHGKDQLDHLALIVDIADGQYPEVAEWGTADTVNPLDGGSQDYVKRGWTWPHNEQTWLQNAYPGVRAHLLHIGTTTVITY